MHEGDPADAPVTEHPKDVPPADLSTAYSLQDSFRNVAENVLPVVVEVNVVEVIKQKTPQFSSPFDFLFGPNDRQEGDSQEREYRRPGLGSGVIVRKVGEKVYVLTNSHVVGQGDEISVALYDGREFEAKIIGKDDRLDLSLIEFDTGEDVPVATLGDSDALYVGDWVLAVGNPYGFESTVTAGIVSALGRRPDANMRVSSFTDYIQTDAAINPGNSGGALVNLKGEIVGLNTWIASQSGGSVGVGFAIPINNAKKAIEDFIERGSVEYGWLGVSIQDPADKIMPGVAEDLGLENKKGSLVVNVYENSPAVKGGFLPGDFITKVGKTKITDSNHLTRVVGNLPPNEEIKFEIIRYKQSKTLNITLEVRKSEEELAKATNLWPGITPVGLSDEIREQLKLPEEIQGAVIGNVFPNTPAAKVGLKSGDIVVSIDKKGVANVLDFYKVLNETPGNEVMFRVYREGNEMLLGLVK
jgi:serine protease Do